MIHFSFYRFQFTDAFFSPCLIVIISVTPLNIRLLGAPQPLSAGRRYDLLCQSAGSRPPAVITWWRDGQRLEKTTETVRDANGISKFNHTRRRNTCIFNQFSIATPARNIIYGNKRTKCCSALCCRSHSILLSSSSASRNTIHSTIAEFPILLLLLCCSGAPRERKRKNVLRHYWNDIAGHA